jgi:PAS domain S-box-containing protein
MKYKDYNGFFIGFLFAFLALLVISFFKTKSIEEKSEQNYNFIEKLYKVELIYRDVHSVVSNELAYINYDLLNKKLEECDELIRELESSDKLASLSDDKYKITEGIKKLRIDFEKKREEIESFKALNAAAVNSLRYLESSDWIYKDKERFGLLVKIVTLGIDKNIDTNELYTKVSAIPSKNDDDAILKIHAVNIIKASSKIREISSLFNPEKKSATQSLKETMIAKFKTEEAADRFIKDGLYLMTSIFLFLLIVTSLLLSKSKKELYKFHSAIDKSDSFVAMTDKYGKITYLNDVFAQILGGQKRIGSQVLSLFEHDETVFKQMADSLEANGIYKGELRLLNRGEPIFIKITVLGIYDKESLDSVLYMGMDITNEKKLEENLREINKHLNEMVEQKVKEIKQKDAILLQHSRIAAMAEAISSIAHHWRQPLNALGIIIQDLKMASDYGELNSEYINSSVLKSKEIITQMSKTIDVFRGFLNMSGEREVFDLSFAIQKVILLSDATFKNSHVKTDIEYPKMPLLIDGYVGDVTQCMLSIILNAKENFEQKNIKNPKLTIKTDTDGESAYVNICDNGGGCDVDVLDKIFEPYFTTKKVQTGAGLGLFMAKNIIEKNMRGRIEAYNNEGGLCIKISLPLHKD